MSWFLSRRRLAPCLLLAAVAPVAVGAQTSFRSQFDNDYFNFWQPVRNRTDVDYTQGAAFTVVWSARAPALAHWLGAAAPCAAGTAAARACTRASVTFGQDMYSPWNNTALLLPGDRPYAGWLYLRGETRRESDARLDALGVTIGVTGPPSLAEAAQTAWHDLFGFRKRLGWSGQLPFEPGVIVSYQGARRVWQAGRSGAVAVALVPSWEVRVGTVNTDATLGADVTVGVRPPPPWPSPRPVGGKGLGAYLRAGFHESVVARDVFLDGSTFSESPHVSKRTLVSQVDAGIGIRAGRVRFEFLAHERSLAYDTQPSWHTYSTLRFTIE